MGGLAVAARLSALGHDLTVYEQAAGPGGKNAGLAHDGFRFDMGPSTLTLPAVYRDLFLKTGRSLEESVDLQEVDPAFDYHFPDGTSLTLPGAGAGACANAMQEAFGGDTGCEWRALLRRAGQIWSLTRSDVLGRALHSYRDLLPLARSPQRLRTVAPWRTMRQLGHATLRDPRARMILDRYATEMVSTDARGTHLVLRPRPEPAAWTVLHASDTSARHWLTAADPFGSGCRIVLDSMRGACDGALVIDLQASAPRPADAVVVVERRRGERTTEYRALPIRVHGPTEAPCYAVQPVDELYRPGEELRIYLWSNQGDSLQERGFRVRAADRCFESW